MSKKTFYVFIFAMLLIFQSHGPRPVYGGKKSLMMGVALGAAIRSRGDLQLLHVLIPLKMAVEAWKQFGKHHHHHHEHYDDYHHGYYRRR